MMKIVMLLRQKYWRNNMTTSKTVTQIQAKQLHKYKQSLFA